MRKLNNDPSGIYALCNKGQKCVLFGLEKMQMDQKIYKYLIHHPHILDLCLKIKIQINQYKLLYIL